MALPGNKNFSDYDNYITDQNPTTSAQAQDYFRNQAELLKAVIDCDFWQPETVYQPGDVVKSDSMPNGTEAVMVATKASVTSNVEPQWGAVGGANISDGACFWKLRWQHWSKSIATQSEAEAGTDNTKGMTPLGTANFTNKRYAQKTYYQTQGLNILGLSSTSTLEDIYNTMPNYGKWTFWSDVLSNLVLPISAGMVTIEKNDDYLLLKLVHPSWTNLEYKAIVYKGTDVVKWFSTFDDVAGTVKIWAGTSVPKGWLACNGAEVSRTTYADLFSAIGTTYGAGDGSTTFNLPNLNNGSFLEGSNTVGTVKNAGLPNVKGERTSVFAHKMGTYTGAYKLEHFNGYRFTFYNAGEWIDTDATVSFDANRCSSVYRDDITTVQPKAVTVTFCIKY